MHSPTTSPLRGLLLPEGGEVRYYRLLVSLRFVASLRMRDTISN